MYSAAKKNEFIDVITRDLNHIDGVDANITEYINTELKCMYTSTYIYK